MQDESAEISGRTWLRAASSISKVGYMDGASDGQTATFQSSFNSGFELGLNFGFILGYNKAMISLQERSHNEIEPRDARRINCQICTNCTTVQDNVVNLYNIQKEKNDELVNNFRHINTNT